MSKIKMTCPSGNVIQILFFSTENDKFWRIQKIKMSFPTFDNSEIRNLCNLLQAIKQKRLPDQIDIDNNFKIQIINKDRKKK